MTPASAHVSVLLTEVVEALKPSDDGCYVDGTFGAGGYAEALLRAAACRVYAFDRDPEAIAGGADLVRRYGGRLELIHDCFSKMDSALSQRNVDAVDGVTLDVGASSIQFDNAERGFSFQKDGPLDMRMGREGPTAADAVNTYAEDILTRIIRTYGEERRARAIARAIGRARRDAPITRTRQLAEIVSGAAKSSGAGRIHPATRTFQALRIFVNDELTELADGLGAAERVLKPAGRLAVVAFHSLEDRIVKRFLAERAGKRAGTSRHLPRAETRPPSFDLVGLRPCVPTEDELKLHPLPPSCRV